MRRSVLLIVAAMLVATGTVTKADAAGPLAFTATTLKGGGGEPSVAISPNGRNVVAAGLSDTPATFFLSTDSGRSFHRTDPSFDSAGGGDWDMRWLDDKRMVGVDLALADGVYVHSTGNAGETWASTQIHGSFDRPWVDHYRDTVYVVAKGFPDGIPHLYTSLDGGRSFGDVLPIPMIVYGDVVGGVDPVTGWLLNQNAYLDHLVVDPRRGDVYVLFGVSEPTTISSMQPVGASNRLYVAHLEDGRFVSHEVRHGGADESYLGGFNWMTIDAAGTLYVMANARIGGAWSTWLSYSKDKAATWSPLVNVGAKGGASFYGAIAGGDPGVLSMVYLRGDKPDPASAQPWYAEMARIEGGDTRTPRVERSRPVAKPVHLADVCFDGLFCGLPGFGEDRELLDFISNAVGPDGTAYGVVASDGPATNHEAGSADDVIVFRQSGGRSHGKGAPS